MLSKRIKLIFNLSIVMVLSILLMACNPEGPQSTFDAQGPVSEIQKNLFLFTFWIAVIVFIVVEGAILFVTFRYRRKNDELPVQTHGNLKLEIVLKDTLPYIPSGSPIILFSSLDDDHTISEAFTNNDVAIDKSEVQLPEGPIKETGDHNIVISVHPEVSVEVLVKVSPE